MEAGTFHVLLFASRLAWHAGCPPLADSQASSPWGRGCAGRARPAPRATGASSPGPGARPELLLLLLSSVSAREGLPSPGGDLQPEGVTPRPWSLRRQTVREELFSGTWDKKQLTLNKFLLKVRVLGLLKVQNNVKKKY